MRRKLIKLGPSSIGISLPKNWVERFYLKQKEEVDLDEIETKLVISNINEKRKFNSIHFNLDSFDNEIVHDLIVGMYKFGLKDINVTGINKEKAKLIKNVVDTTIGFEIISMEANKLHLIDLGISDEISLEKAEQQIYWRLLNMLNQITDAKTTNEDIKNTDLEINKLAFFIQRNLASKISNNPNNFLRFEKISALESFGDALRSYKEYTPPRKIDTNFISSIEKITDKLRSLIDKPENFHSVKKDLINLEKEISMKKSKKESSVLASILILKNLKQLFEITLAMQIEKLSHSIPEK